MLACLLATELSIFVAISYTLKRDLVRSSVRRYVRHTQLCVKLMTVWSCGFQLLVAQRLYEYSVSEKNTATLYAFRDKIYS